MVRDALISAGERHQLFVLRSRCVPGFGPAAVAPIAFYLGTDTVR